MKKILMLAMVLGLLVSGVVYAESLSDRMQQTFNEYIKKCHECLELKENHHKIFLGELESKPHQSGDIETRHKEAIERLEKRTEEEMKCLKEEADLLRKYNETKERVDKEYYDNLAKVRIGMTAKQVLRLTGEPNEVNRTVGKWGVHEQWVMGIPPYKTIYLYFQNGILTSFQD